MASPCNSGYKRTKGLDLFTPRSSLSSAVAQAMAYDGTPIATVYAGSLRLSEVYCETRDQLSSHVGFPVNEPATDGGAGSAVTTGPCRADFDGHDRKGWNSVRVEGIKQ